MSSISPGEGLLESFGELQLCLLQAAGSGPVLSTRPEGGDALEEPCPFPEHGWDHP